MEVLRFNTWETTGEPKDITRHGVRQATCEQAPIPNEVRIPYAQYSWGNSKKRNTYTGAMADHAQPQQAMANHDWPWEAMEDHGEP